PPPPAAQPAPRVVARPPADNQPSQPQPAAPSRSTQYRGGATGAGSVAASRRADLQRQGAVAAGEAAPASSAGDPSSASVRPRAMRVAADAPDENESAHPHIDPYSGKMGTVMGQLAAGKKSDALATARAWRAEEPGDVLALVALGEATEAN